MTNNLRGDGGDEGRRRGVCDVRGGKCGRAHSWRDRRSEARVIRKIIVHSVVYQQCAGGLRVIYPSFTVAAVHEEAVRSHTIVGIVRHSETVTLREAQIDNRTVVNTVIEIADVKALIGWTQESCITEELVCLAFRLVI